MSESVVVRELSCCEIKSGSERERNNWLILPAVHTLLEFKD